MPDAVHMTTSQFEELYRRDGDPWRYASSEYEREKYAATLSACGSGPFDRALELGGSIGIFTAALAPRCRSLVSVDAAPTAVQAARRRLGATPGVEVILGVIPDAVPPGPYDLVVASEILYYLKREALEATLEVVRDRIAPGGRLIAVHWLPSGPERPFTAEQVHARLRELGGVELVDSAGTAEYLLDVFARR
jgi:SAM-dependent methyltransferase